MRRRFHVEQRSKELARPWGLVLQGTTQRTQLDHGLGVEPLATRSAAACEVDPPVMVEVVELWRLLPQTPDDWLCVIRADNICTMYTQEVDEVSEAVVACEAFVEQIWSAFDAGRQMADDFFVERERKPDAHLWAHLVRYVAVEQLKQTPFVFLFRHHSGIEFQTGGFAVRVCKAVGFGPQPPGHNRTRREYFQQMSLSFFTSANLLLCWDVVGEDLQLLLCKPRGLWRFKGQPKLEWCVPIHYDPIAGLKFEGPDYDIEVSLDTDELNEGQTGS